MQGGAHLHNCTCMHRRALHISSELVCITCSRIILSFSECSRYRVTPFFLSLSHSLDPRSLLVTQLQPVHSPSFLMLGSYSRACGACKKKLRSIFITQTDRAGRPSGAHKKCLFTYGDWSAATGVMPLALFFVLPFFCNDAGKKCAPHVDWSRGQMT